MTDTMIRCIYCDELKPTYAFSLEHIFPRRLGGALCDDKFKTRCACQRCNNILGLFVDGMFTKNFFATNEEMLAAYDYLDLDNESSRLPLTYMGSINDLPLSGDEICEVWLSACGARLYHMHNRDDEKYASYAGGNPIARKADPGRAYVVLTSEHPKWVSVALRSFLQYFPDSTRYAINFLIQNDPSYFSGRPVGEAGKEFDLIKSICDKPHNHRIVLQLGFEQRFIAKLALGLGTNVIGPTFPDSLYARHLRNAMWERDPEARSKIPIKGSGFVDDLQSHYASIVGWLGAYVILIMPVGSILALSLVLPSGKSINIAISDDPAIWYNPDLGLEHYGEVSLILPQLAAFIGHIPLPNYLAHKTGAARLPALADLELRRVARSTLPPCR